MKTPKTMLITGGTGKGKSTLLEEYIQTLLNHNDVDLLIIDPKQVEFWDYRDKENVILVNNEIKDYIVNELKKLIDERQSSNGKKLVIIVDEFAEIKFDKKCDSVFKFMIKNRKELNIELALASQIPTIFCNTYKQNSDIIIKFQ
jgi:type IV secretory pathway VirB4 component